MNGKNPETRGSKAKQESRKRKKTESLTAKKIWKSREKETAKEKGGLGVMG